MSELLVFYATTDGQTRRIAEHMSARLRDTGIDNAVVDIRSDESRRVDWSSVRAVAVGASVRAGRHQHEAAEFVQRHHGELNARPSAFFSVSLKAASDKPDDLNGAERMARAFVESAGWQPQHVACIAGCLAYRKYGWLTRFFMRQMAKKIGLPTDTSRNHEYTNWAQVDRLADDLAAAAQVASAAAAPVAS